MDERELQRHRAMIDVMDKQILDLLNERMRIVSALGPLKSRAGLDIVDSQREHAVLRRIRELNCGPLDAESAVRIFQAIIHEARRAQLREARGPERSSPLPSSASEGVRP